MRHLRHIWKAEGNAFLSAIELLSGITLVLYGICAMSAPIPDPRQDIIPWAVSRAVAPVVWQTVIIVIGVLQITCAIHKNPLCSIVTSYPAMVACLFAGISGVMYGGSFDALAWFAIAWGLLNLLVVRHNKKLWDIRSGSAN